MSELLSLTDLVKRSGKRVAYVKAVYGHLAIPCPEGTTRPVWSRVTIEAFDRRRGEIAAEKVAA